MSEGSGGGNGVGVSGRGFGGTGRGTGSSTVVDAGRGGKPSHVVVVLRLKRGEVVGLGLSRGLE